MTGSLCAASNSDETVRGNKNVLGGKGANLDGMASIGLPVPPGFTITTEMCSAYYANGQTFPDSVRAEVANGIAHIEQATGKVFAAKLARYKELTAAAPGGQ